MALIYEIIFSCFTLSATSLKLIWHETMGVPCFKNGNGLVAAINRSWAPASVEH